MVGAQPAPRLKRERHGLAVIVGVGLAYSGIGGQLRYDIPVRPSLTVSPFVAAGFFGALSGPVGVSTALGARHRLVADLGVAPLLQRSLILHGTTITDETMFGPIAGAGYEHLSDGGWIQRFTVEYGYAAWGSAAPPPPPERHQMFVSFAFGWRIW